MINEMDATTHETFLSMIMPMIGKGNFALETDGTMIGGTVDIGNLDLEIASAIGAHPNNLEVGMLYGFLLNLLKIQQTSTLKIMHHRGRRLIIMQSV